MTDIILSKGKMMKIKLQALMKSTGSSVYVLADLLGLAEKVLVDVLYGEGSLCNESVSMINKMLTTANICPECLSRLVHAGGCRECISQSCEFSLCG